MTDLPKVSHYGTIQIGDLAFDGAVLEDGTRGYVQRQLTKAVGLREKTPGTQIRRFLGDIAPNALSVLDKSGYARVVMPHGGHAGFLPAGILTEIVSGVIDAALAGELHHKQQSMVKPCQAIYRALATTGEVALIDEATGYQYHREPDALQDLIGRLIREHCADWERRFHPDYYKALYSMLGWAYVGQHRHHPLIGQITGTYVYGVIFPAEVMGEIRERRERYEKLHQWLNDGGLRMAENQIKAVEIMANSSADLEDFKSRCHVAFRMSGQSGFVFPAHDVR